MSAQKKIERQVAAMHAVIAERLRAGDLVPLVRAHDNLARWRTRFGGELPPAYREWSVLLDDGLDAVLAVLEGDNEDAVRRRSSSPFTGVLTPQDRWRIVRHAA